MSFTCPNGHQSETSDYCDQCGAKIDGAAATSAPPIPARAGDPASAPDPAAGTAVAAGAGDELCPVCHAPRVGDDRFCESCGFDYTAPPPPIPDPTAPAAAWEAIVTADRDYFDRMAPDGVPFPLHCPPRTFALAGGEIRVGRRSSSRGIQPEVDLSGAPEDSAISHLHCLLLEQADGSYALVDPGSTNGTTLNDDSTPLAANNAVAVSDGDRIHLGAWTTITMHRKPPPAGTGAP